jgi:hypothetical protein
MSRLYSQIWEQLKSLSIEDATNKGVRISAPRPHHKRIIKGLKKEKWMDVGYKIRIEPKVATLVSFRDNSIVTFRLRFSLTSEDF